MLAATINGNQSFLVVGKREHQNINKLLQYGQRKAASLLQPTNFDSRRTFPVLYSGSGDAPTLPLFPGGSGLPPNTWFLVPIRVHNPNGIANGSAV